MVVVAPASVPIARVELSQLLVALPVVSALSPHEKIARVIAPAASAIGVRSCMISLLDHAALGAACHRPVLALRDEVR